MIGKLHYTTENTHVAFIYMFKIFKNTLLRAYKMPNKNYKPFVPTILVVLVITRM